MRTSQQEKVIYLKQLEVVTLDATDGTDTFEASGVFPGGVYGLPSMGLSRPTPACKAVVHEMVADGSYSQLFGSLGEDRIRWTEAQVVKFCRENPGKLRTGGYATFFELEGNAVASVYFVDNGRLLVGVDPFSYDNVWYASYAHRLGSLQLAA